jgi:pimeloyl-ACP methyl ester carboxylesterase
MTSGHLAFLASLLCAATAAAQLIAPGQPVPRNAKPPVVFMNGYQSDCANSTFASTFGSADVILQANGEASVFFDNCTVAGSPSIEKIGSAFGSFLAGLTYADGSAVSTVDVVAHSMGGLILRSYLSGKQDTEGMFDPPPATRIRKTVFFATPHFGSPVAALGLGTSPQLDELSSGSHFLFDLNTWNDNSDDLRGIDALAEIGNGGTGIATTPGFDDGVVGLTSAALGFYLPGRTRVLPYCHVDGGGLISLGGLCSFDAKGIAKIRAATDDNARILVSFLNGTADWQSIGQAAEQNSFLSTGGGLQVRPFTAAGALQKLHSAAASGSGTSKTQNAEHAE